MEQRLVSTDLFVNLHCNFGKACTVKGSSPSSLNQNGLADTAVARAKNQRSCITQETMRVERNSRYAVTRMTSQSRVKSARERTEMRNKARCEYWRPKKRPSSSLINECTGTSASLIVFGQCDVFVWQPSREPLQPPKFKYKLSTSPCREMPRSP